jgi:hypothetical protein
MVATTPPYCPKNDVVAMCFVALDLKSSSVVLVFGLDNALPCHRGAIANLACSVACGVGWNLD